MPPVTKVLIIDDSVVNRRALINNLQSENRIEVCGFAANGNIGWTKIGISKPDVILLDIDMPEMGGLELLKKIRQNGIKTPVIMLSSHDEAEQTIDALAYGANDYLNKPPNLSNSDEAVRFVGGEVIPKIMCYSPYYETKQAGGSGPERPRENHKRSVFPRIDVLAVGVSTGGPKALQTFLSGFRGKIDVPVLIVQHMPPKFTSLLAERLTLETGLHVIEGFSGAVVESGKVILAPGDFHMIVKREAAAYKIELNQWPLENSCRPAVDVLFRTVADVYGENALAVILTGMGQDGLIGCEHIKKVGGQVLVQDKNTSVVWGMPGAVVSGGLADGVFPIEKLSDEVTDIINMGRMKR